MANATTNSVNSSSASKSDLLTSQLGLSSSQTDSVFESLDPKAHVEAFWNRQTRPDGRMFSQARPASTVSSLLKHSSGSAMIKQGETKILAAMTTQIGQPSPELPDHGDVVVTVTNEGQSDYLQSWLQRMLDGIFPSKLNLLTGKACIRLMVTVMVLQDAGNLMDAALLACMAAWKDTKLPSMDDLQEVDGKLWLREEKASTKKSNAAPSSNEKENDQTQSISAAVDDRKNEFLVSLTMGIITINNEDESNESPADGNTSNTYFLVDPSLVEEQHLNGSLTLVVTIPNKTIQAEYSGCVGLSAKELALATKMAYGRADELMVLL